MLKNTLKKLIVELPGDIIMIALGITVAYYAKVLFM